MPESTKSTLESITSSLSSFAKGLFTRPEPYDIKDKTKDPKLEYDTSKESILKSLNDKLISKSKDGNVTLFTMEEFDYAIQYIGLQRELKPRDYLQLKDGKITYEDFEKVAQDVENVSQLDHSFGKMPKIFIMSKLPPQGFREREILDIVLGSKTDNMMYNVLNDSVTIITGSGHDFSVSEGLGGFAHEYRHRIKSADDGFMKAEYDLNKHAHALLGDKFAGGCEKYLFDGKFPDDLSNLSKFVSFTEPDGKCADTLKHINEDKIHVVDLKVKNKNTELSYRVELDADQVAALANPEYAKGIISYLKNNNFPNGDEHPSSLQRIEEIGQVLANPAYYKAQLEKHILEKHINDFKQFAPQPANSDTAEKIPATTPAQSSALNNREAAPKF